MTEAEAHHPESVALIDRYAQWFTPAILLCAAITWGITQEFNRAVTVLIVGCPCALILAAPTAIVATISRAAKSGILIKGGRYIENAAHAGTVLFDKTGTLTKGDPRVDEIFSSEGYDADYVLQQAACVEQNSTHPLARAVLKAAHYARVTLGAAENLMTEIGLGVKGCVGERSIEVGSAMGAQGTEVALETADIALMQDDISKIPFLIKLGRRMVTTIKWNIFFGLAFNLVAVLAGGSGLLSPIMGAVVHNIGSVLVVLSSASIAFAGD